MDSLHTLHLIGSKKIGGAERWFYRFTQALKEYGHTVELAVRKKSELTKHGLTNLSCYELPFSTVWDPLSRHAVTSLISLRCPHIVQTYMGRATRLTRLSKNSSIIHVARLGGYYKIDGYRHAHAWIGNTKGLCDYMLSQGLPSERVFHISNFVDIPVPEEDDKIDVIREQLGLRPDDMVMLTPGRFMPVKGHSTLIEAFAQLPVAMEGRRLYLILLGDGKLANALYFKSRRFGVEKRILWPGWQSHPGLYYQLADLVVFPSLEQETLGNVVLEAWSHKKPVVCTEFRGALEITQHGCDVWRVPCQDPPALASGIRHVLSSPGLKEELVEKGYEKVCHEFSKAKIVSQYVDLYRSLLS